MDIKIIGYLLLIIGGLAHLLPDVFAPIVMIGSGVFTIQRVIGLLSVLIGIVLFIKK